MLAQEITIVIPCYNEQESIEPFIERVSKVETSLGATFTLVFIDDGSNDHTFEILKKSHQENPKVHYISFSRNFGKEAGLYVGLKKAIEYEGDYIAVMDVDLQDPPELLADMLRVLTDDAENYDCAAAYRTTRDGESKIRSFFARRFYAFMNGISEVEMKDGARDFRLMKRRVAEAIVSMPERVRFSKGLFAWVGFDTKWIPYESIERERGTTSWSFFGLMRYAFEGIIAFSTLPLEIISFAGFFIFLISLAFLVFVVIRAALFGDPVAGWPSLVSLVTLLGGIQIFCSGILGMYLSKVYTESKQRPLYLVDEEA